MKDKKVLVVGGGGRCHAIVDAFSRSLRTGKIYCAPGNAGIAEQAECVAIKDTDVMALADFAEKNGIDLTVVGPEAALAAGIADEFHKRGLKIFGPTKEGVRIESSKEFAKEIMMRHDIPTAGYRSYSDFNEALEYVKGHSVPVVVKYDGLAAGKGVVVAQTHEEAEEALRSMLLDESFGKGRVVIEDFLAGPEFSFMCVVSGRKVYPLAIAQDHKRAYDGDKGPNTGGMGTYSPVPFITDDVRDEALKTIMQRTADALADEGIEYTGVLYGGLILTDEGPKVIEFNARFGDPETEVVLPRLESDIYSLFEAALEQRDFPIEWSRDECLGIVLASKGYPGSYEKGKKILLPEDKDAVFYHMGTRRDGDDLVTAGGRVLMVVGRGDTLAEAKAKAEETIGRIECDALFHRTDIGKAVL